MEINLYISCLFISIHIMWEGPVSLHFEIYLSSFSKHWKTLLMFQVPHDFCSFWNTIYLSYYLEVRPCKMQKKLGVFLHFCIWLYNWKKIQSRKFMHNVSYYLVKTLAHLHINQKPTNCSKSCRLKHTKQSLQ